MTVLTDHALPTRARLVHAWLPVALSLLVAAGAGWAIMHLNAASYLASQDRESANGLAGDLDGPAQLLIAGSQARLAASGSAALVPTPGAPTSMSSTTPRRSTAWSDCAPPQVRSRWSTGLRRRC